MSFKRAMRLLRCCEGILEHSPDCPSTPGMRRFGSSEFDPKTYEGTKTCDVCEGDGTLPDYDDGHDGLEGTITCEACDGDGLVPDPKA